MINRILMELAEDYFETGSVDKLLDFSQKTFPSDGTSMLFVGLMLIMFSRTDNFKPKYSCSRENLLSIVMLAKEKVGNSNLLAFYVDRVNTTKGIKKYLNDIVSDDNLDKYADVIIEYLDHFKPDMVSEIKKHSSLDDYIKSLDGKLDLS